MAVVWMTGAEDRQSRAELMNAGWVMENGSNTGDHAAPHQTAAGYGGGAYSYYCDGNNQGFQIPASAESGGIDGIGLTGFIAHFSMLWEWTTSTEKRIWGVSAGGLAPWTDGIYINWSGWSLTNPAIRLYINGSLIATSTATFSLSQTAGSHRHFVLDVDDVSTPGQTRVKVYVDGVEIIDSGASASHNISAIVDIQFGAGYRSSTDHLVIWDRTDAVADLATALANVYIQGLYPDGDSADGAWTRSDTGTNTDLYAVLTDPSVASVDTSTDPDTLEITVQDKADVDALWSPTVLAVQTTAQVLGGGGITTVTVDHELDGSSSSSAAKTLNAAYGTFRHITDGSVADLDTVKAGITVT